MSPPSSRHVLRVLGALLLVVAAVRFGMDVFGSVHATGFSAPDAGFVVGFTTDYITLGIGVVGVLLFALGFRAPRNPV